ncbi:helix-turn-helix domain-containing protein [Sphingomonas mesophila]|uniref:helix-turn-helix domain-containing protein n=1 Tax=Sphingomonas mesophila TaxID=2303576 RepID=UPI000E572B56
MQKLTVTVKEACEALSISKTTFYDMLRKGVPLACVFVGRRRLVTTDSLKAWIASNVDATSEMGAD